MSLINIFIPILSLMLIALAMVLFIYTIIIPEKLKRGRLVFEVDYKTRKIRIAKHKTMNSSKIPGTQRVHAIYSGSWIPLDKFINLFNHNTTKKIRNALYSVDQDKAVEERVLLFQKNNKESEKYSIISQYKKTSNDLIQIRLQYTFIEKEHLSDNSKQWVKSDLKKINEDYIGILALKLVDVNSGYDKVFKDMNRLWKFRKVYYIIENDLMIIIMPTKNPVKLKLMFDKKIYKNLKRVRLRHFFTNAAVQFAHTPRSPKDTTNLLLKTRFALNKAESVDGIAIFSKEKDSELFEEFKKSFLIIDQMIRANSIESQSTKIKNYKSERHLINYVFPSSNGISQKLFATILKDEVLKAKLIDAHVENYIGKKKSNPALIDINAYWLISNIDKIKNDKIIYCVRFTRETDLKTLIHSIQNLQDRNIYCAIRIEKLDQRAITLIDGIRPQFLLIDREISKNAYKRNVFSNLTRVNQIASNINSKIIFELPSKKIDERQVKKIGLNFYYNFE